VVQLLDDLKGDEAALFASGTLMLEDEDTPLQPAQLRVLSPRSAELTIHEGRYHQVKRMFEATGNQVLELHRARFGNLDLGDLPEGEFRILEPAEVEGI
jgi:16S rRNA pseudouridine516 synthase